MYFVCNPYLEWAQLREDDAKAHDSDATSPFRKFPDRGHLPCVLRCPLDSSISRTRAYFIPDATCKIVFDINETHPRTTLIATSMIGVRFISLQSWQVGIPQSTLSKTNGSAASQPWPSKGFQLWHAMMPSGRLSDSVLPLPLRCSPPRCATSAAHLSQGVERFLARRLRRPGQSQWTAAGTSLPTWHFGQKNRKRPSAGWSSSQFATGGLPAREGARRTALARLGTAALARRL